MSTTTARPVTARELATLLKHGRTIDLIDVRTPAEFESLHVEGAVNVPLNDLDPVEVSANRQDQPNARLYLICQKGPRSQQAAERFHRAGFENAVWVEGGTDAAREAGLPMKEGKKTISLERQVRIAAGSMVFAGTLLGAFVHPGFLAIPAFVGAGLVFAGITDTCGMAMILARMPWNNRRASCCAK